MRPADSSISEVELQQGMAGLDWEKAAKSLVKWRAIIRTPLSNGQIRRDKGKNGEALQDSHEGADIEREPVDFVLAKQITGWYACCSDSEDKYKKSTCMTRSAIISRNKTLQCIF